MLRASAIIICLLALALASGCASSRLPSTEPQSLDQVNQQLEDRWARIQTTDDAFIEHLEDVRVGVDSTRFYHRLKQREGSIPTDSLHQIAIRGDTGSGWGFLIGAAPGLAGVATGGIILGTRGDNGSIGTALAGVFYLGGGAILGLVGGLSGALIGDAVTPDEWKVIYDGPVGKHQNGRGRGR